jgi:hypothetical protein
MTAALLDIKSRYLVWSRSNKKKKPSHPRGENVTVEDEFSVKVFL